MKSNADGSFVASNIPESHITIFAVRDGYVQPCGLTADIHGDRTLDVEMMSRSRLDAAVLPRPGTIPGPSLIGLTFETVAGIRQPVGGVDLWVGDSLDVGVASSLSNPRGEFFLCNLPKGVYIYASKSGYEPTSQQSIDVSGSSLVEIELKRH